MNNFSFEERMEEIDSSIASYNSLKKLRDDENPLVLISSNLIKLIESSIVIAIYSLSEQLLKSTIYKILEVDFSEDTQTYKDKFILDKISPEKHPITPDIDRINKELKIYNNKLNMKIPKVVNRYKIEYEKLIDARHKYAHGNKHTENIDFDYAKKFIEYLRVVYEDLVQEKSIVSYINDLKKQLENLLGHESIEQFRHHFSGCSNNLENIKTTIVEKIENNKIYDIAYIDDLYTPLENILKELENIYQNNEYIQDDSFEKDMNSLKQELSDYN